MTDTRPTEISLLLQSVHADKAAAEDLLPLVYEELRQLAAVRLAEEKPGQTLQPTALVHEAYLRLVGSNDLKWENRRHFFAAAARSMRQILINRANRKKAVKHGGKFVRHELSDAVFQYEPEPEWLLAMEEALNKLETIDPRKGEIVMLRYFAGLSIEDTANALQLSSATVKREWQFSKAWLQRELTAES